MGLLRTLLAITVVLAHSPWNHGFVFVGGQLAVQLFYVMSGFLISHVIRGNQAYASPLRFYISRALRLYPIYYVVAALALIFRMAADPAFFQIYRIIPTAASVLLVGSNLLVFGQDWVMFSGVDNGQLVLTTDFRQSDVLLYEGLLLPQAWTLGVELSFYALAPFVLRSSRLVVLLLLLSLGVRTYVLSLGIGTQDPWTYRFFPTELRWFLLGALSNRFLLPWWERIVRRGLVWLPAAATGFLVILTVFYFVTPIDDGYKRRTLCASFLILLPLTFLFQNRSKLDRTVGNLSYPIYVGHLLAMSVLVLITPRLGVRDPLLISAANVVASLAFAFALNRLVGDPIESLRSRWKAAPPPGSAEPRVRR
jgi:peptidoglycan/LPS O-acetylase OafA/YrhL